MHADLTAMQETMSAPDFYSTEDDIAGFMRRYEAQRARVADLERAWDRLTDDG